MGMGVGVEIGSIKVPGVSGRSCYWCDCSVSIPLWVGWQSMSQ